MDNVLLERYVCFIGQGIHIIGGESVYVVRGYEGRKVINGYNDL